MTKIKERLKWIEPIVVFVCLPIHTHLIQVGKGITFDWMKEKTFDWLKERKTMQSEFVCQNPCNTEALFCAPSPSSHLAVGLLSVRLWKKLEVGLSELMIPAILKLFFHMSLWLRASVINLAWPRSRQFVTVARNVHEWRCRETTSGIPPAPTRCG